THRAPARRPRPMSAAPPRPRPRCVLHASAVVAGFFGVRSQRVLALWRRGGLVLCTTPIVEAHYAALSETFDVWHDEVAAFLRELRDSACVERIPDPAAVREFPDHPEDADFAACALAASAPLVCVDRH